MFGFQEILLHARIDRTTLEMWVRAGWVVPQRQDGEQLFSELDLARTRLICELRDEIGINEEGIGVALGLLDQIHGLRQAMRRILTGLEGLPEPLRRDAIAALRTSADRTEPR